VCCNVLQCAAVRCCVLQCAVVFVFCVAHAVVLHLNRVYELTQVAAECIP